jgi:hypothetical protein
MKKYVSRFIVDVIETQHEIILRDSSGGEYHINRSKSEMIEKYNFWFENVFSKGISHTLTILSVKSVDISECETELHVLDFVNLCKNNIN